MQQGSRNLTAFISCSFRAAKKEGEPSDQEEVVKPLIQQIIACGIRPVMLNWKLDAGRNVDVMVKQIQRCNLFVAIVTRRDKVEADEGHGGGRYRTSPLIIQELGVACSLNKEIVVFLEDGVDEADLGMGKDLTYLGFERPKLTKLDESPDESKGANDDLLVEPSLGERIKGLLFSAKQRYLERLQILDQFEVKIPEKAEENKSTDPKRRARTLPVYELADVGPWMNPETFHRGLEILYDQVRTEPNELYPDLFIGINATGAMIAAYLNGRIYGKDRRPMGIVKTGAFKYGEQRKLYTACLPSVETVESSIMGERPLQDGGVKKNDATNKGNSDNEKKEVIAVVADGQLKTGKSWQKVKNELIRFYQEKEKSNIKLTIFYVVHVACGIDLPQPKALAKPLAKETPPMTMEELFSKHNPEWKGGAEVPHFLAYVSKADVKPLEDVP